MEPIKEKNGRIQTGKKLLLQIQKITKKLHDNKTNYNISSKNNVPHTDI